MTPSCVPAVCPWCAPYLVGAVQNLAYFEMSPHRAALIHLRGATRLEAVLPHINPKIYPQQLKQVRRFTVAPVLGNSCSVPRALWFWHRPLCQPGALML